MAVVALTILLCLLLAAFLYGKRNLLSPWFLLCLAITACYCIVLFNSKKWDVDINVKFIIYVSTALIFWWAGDLAFGQILPSAPKTRVRVSPEEAGLKTKYPATLFIVLSAALAFIYVYKLLSDAGGYGSLSEKLRHIYDSVVNGYTPGFFYSQMLEAVVAIAYVNTYRLFQRMYSRRDRVSIIKLIIPVIIFMVTVLFTTDRNIFLRYAFYAITLYVMFYMANTKKRNPNLSIVLRVVLMMAGILLLFFLLGKAKRYSSNLLNSLSIYGGSGLNNFNIWIKNYNGEMMLGNSTLSTFFRSFEGILRTLGFKVDFNTVARFDEFITYTGSTGYIYSSNVYTALKPFVEDFGYLGVIILPFLLGGFYRCLFNNALRHKYGFSWVLYCMLIYPIIFFPIAEQLFGRFSLSFLYELFWMAVVYYGVYGVRKKSAKSQKEKKEINYGKG